MVQDTPAPGELDAQTVAAEPVLFAPTPAGLDGADAPGFGWQIEHFKILRELGSGGMGRVLLARDTHLGRLVAIKLLRTDHDDGSHARSLLDEARLTAQLSHPHIVVIHHVGQFRGSPFLALEYLDGENLRDRSRHSPPAERESLRIGVAVAQALACAHAAGITHRDLKPENIVLPRDGRLRVIDFGIAAALATLPAGPHAAKGGQIAGSPGYMAPEQWLASVPDPKMDVWSLGVVLFELLAGHRPFEGPVRDPRPLRMRVLDPRIPVPKLQLESSALAEVVHAMLTRDRDQRPTAEQVAQRLADLLARPTSSAPASPFRGLAAFEEADAPFFFGRDAEIAALLERVRDVTVVPVVGPSGAGKSSLVRAGLVPRLRERGNWIIVALRPGSRPLDSLATRLVVHETTDHAMVAHAGKRREIKDLVDELRREPRTVNLLLHELAESRRCRVLLVVDQLEEVVTHAADEHDRNAFLAGVACAADPVDDLVRVVFTVRDDFLGRVAATEALRAVLRDVFVVSRLDASALRQAIVAPVERLGYAFEDPGLPDAMVAEVAEEPAALPLVQFACAALWERRDRSARLVRRPADEALGGVAGALGRHAEAVLTGLMPAEVEAARRLLLQLVGAEGTRRVVDRDVALAGCGAEGELVLERLTAARLIQVRRARDGRGDATVLEITHESLLRTWPQLARWLEESADDRAALAEVEGAAALWARRNRRPAELWTRDALADARRRVRQREALTPVAQEFLLASEAADARARARRRLWQGGLVAGLLTVTVTALMVAWQASRLSIAAADMGQFDLALTLFDWDPEQMRDKPVDASGWPGLKWEIWEPDLERPHEPGKRRLPAHVRTEEKRIERGQLVQRVETRSGAVFVRISGRGPGGEECGPSWIRLRALPGYAQREAATKPRFELLVPTCQASRAGTVTVPAGPFVFGGLGDPPFPGPLTPKPEREIDLPVYRIDRTEVPNAAYAVYAKMAALTGDAMPDYPDEKTVPLAGQARHPVTATDMYAAAAFCRFLGKRLPTSEEWTKAGRGGLWLDAERRQANPRPRRNLPTGARSPAGANLGAGGTSKSSSPVDGERDPSPYGVIGLVGNVSEWTSSPESAARPDALYVIRGGHWGGDFLAPGEFSLAVENARSPRYYVFALGLRCAADL